MGLADLDVLIVDCQATGATPAHGELLEIGWTIARAGAEPATVHTHRVALSEGRRIPRVVRRLTGLSDESLDDAIAPEDAWRRLSAVATEVQASSPRGTPTVIHFARFELAFLRDLHARFDPGAPFPFDVACAHEMARRLFPGLPRRGLRALAGYLGHGVELERRSSGHVEATASVWRHVASELEARDVRGWSELLVWLEQPPPSLRGRRTFGISRERRLALPEAPGVYRFLRSNGDVLYVGKATSLRHRVSSHFTSGRAGERALEMLTQARDLQVTETASALEAALLETDEIKRNDRPYNVHLRTAGRDAWFATPDLASFAPAPESRRWVGPLPSRGSLAALAAVRSLLDGEAPSPSLRARAVGVPLAFAPGEAAFGEGWAAFVERHLSAAPARTPWGRLRSASKALLPLIGDDAPVDGDEPGQVPAAWDGDRVRRHLERSVAQGGQLMRRSRWLCVLADSAVAVREAGSERRRLIVVAGAELVEQRDLGADEVPPAPPVTRRSWLERQRAFDVTRYDRLRVLATEIKRVLGEGGDVALRVREGPPIGGERLARALRWT